MISQLEVDYYSSRGRQYVTHSGRDEEELLPTISNTKWITQVFSCSYSRQGQLHSRCALTEVRLTGTYNFFFISIFCLEAFSKLRSCIFDEF